MTDQNHSNRDDRDLLADNDPLAELARIISGGPEGRRSKEADHVADEARSDLRDSAKEANQDMAVSSGDEDDFDIEAVLARELREPPSGKQPEAETQEATDTGATAGAATTEPEEPVGDGNEPEETEELSIEEQLMAELAGEDGQDTRQEARSERMAERSEPSAPSSGGLDSRDEDADFDFVDDIVEQMRSKFSSEDDDAGQQNEHTGSGDEPRDNAEDQDDYEQFFERNFEDMRRDDISEVEMAQNGHTEEVAADDLDQDFGEAFESEMDQLSSHREVEAHAPSVTGSHVQESEETVVFSREIHVTQKEAETVSADSGGMDVLEEEFEELFAGELDISEFEELADTEEGPGAPPYLRPANNGRDEAAEIDGLSPGHGTGAIEADVENEIDDLFAADGNADPGDIQDNGLAAGSVVERSGGKGFRMAVMALAAALVLGIGIVSWGLWSGGQSATQSEEPGLIEADNEPVKVKPDDPGGKRIANQDNQVYDRVAGNSLDSGNQDELLSERQEPIAVDTKADTRLSPQNEAPATDESGGLAPKRVRTLTVKPDGTIVRTDAPAPAVTQESAGLAGAPASVPLTPPMSTSNDFTGTQDQSAPASMPLTPPEPTGSDFTGTPDQSTPAEQTEPTSEVAAEEGPRTIDGFPVPTPSPIRGSDETSTNAASNTQAPANQSASLQPTVVEILPVDAAPEPASDTTENAAPSETASVSDSTETASASGLVPTISSSEWKMQISSQRSHDAAEASYNNLRQRFSSILADRKASIQTADIEGRGRFYQVKVLADSRDDAISLCERLKRAGGSCFVTR